MKVDENIREAMGTVKETELEVEGIEEIIVAVSACDSKPVCFF